MTSGSADNRPALRDHLGLLHAFRLWTIRAGGVVPPDAFQSIALTCLRRLAERYEPITSAVTTYLAASARYGLKQWRRQETRAFLRFYTRRGRRYCVRRFNWSDWTDVPIHRSEWVGRDDPPGPAIAADTAEYHRRLVIRLLGAVPNPRDRDIVRLAFGIGGRTPLSTRELAGMYGLAQRSIEHVIQTAIGAMRESAGLSGIDLPL